MDKCIICKREIPEVAEGELAICIRERCHEILEAKQHIFSLNYNFKEFWSTRDPTEANYTDFLILIEKEDSYKAHLIDLEKRGFTHRPSRRAFFWSNIGQVHTGWPTEAECKKYDAIQIDAPVDSGLQIIQK